jgi:pimeloyl-ACP methyl ester carboxylesterase
MAATDWLAKLKRRVKEELSNVPLLLVWGLHDVMFGRRFMERFREDFRNVRVRRLDAKHFIQEDAPGEIAEGIASFLDSSESSTGAA